MVQKKSLLLDASGLPATPHAVVRTLKTYALMDLEVSTDALGPLELLTNARDGFAATIMAVAQELAKRDAIIEERSRQVNALDLQVGQLSLRLEEAHNRLSLLASDMVRALARIETNRLGVDVAQRATEALMVEAGALQ